MGHLSPKMVSYSGLHAHLCLSLAPEASNNQLLCGFLNPTGALSPVYPILQDLRPVRRAAQEPTPHLQVGEACWHGCLLSRKLVRSYSGLLVLMGIFIKL